MTHDGLLQVAKVILLQEILKVATVVAVTVNHQEPQEIQTLEVAA